MGRVLRRSVQGLVAAGLCLAAAGCDLSAPDVWEDRQDALDRNRDRWTSWRVRSYRYTVSKSCECPTETTGPAEITVSDGVITSLTSSRDGEPVPQDLWEMFYTVEDLFALLADAIDRRVRRFEVAYDRTLGHPTAISLDSSEAVDDELRIQVTGLEVVERE